MKKILLSLSALAAGLLSLSAQDFAKATELAKQANDALLNGDYQTAIDNFTSALNEAAASSDEGASELAASCKTGILQAKNALANSFIEADKWKEAIALLDDVVKTAGEYGNEETGADAAEKKQQVIQAAANAEIKAAAAEKDKTAKAAHFKEALGYLESVIAGDPDNGKAILNKGQVLSSLGQKDAAIEAFLLAKDKGMEKDANKQLSNIYVKNANALLNAGKVDEAIQAADESLKYLPNANAYKIAGIACQKKNDMAGAVEYLEKYLTLKPNDAQVKAAVDAIKASLKK